MDKLIKVGVILLFTAVFLVAAVYIGEFSGFVNVANTVDQYNACSSDSLKLDELGVYYAQSFVPTQNTLHSIQVLLTRVHENVSSGNIRVSLKDSKNGDALVYDEIDMKTVERNVEKWYTFNMNNYALVPGKTYYIVVQVTKDVDYPVRLCVCHSDSYPDGELWKKEPGKDWTNLIESSSGRGNTDMTFQTWGKMEIFHGD